MTVPAIAVKRSDEGDAFTIRANRSLFVEFAKTVADKKQKSALTKALKSTEEARPPITVPPATVAAFFAFVAQE